MLEPPTGVRKSTNSYVKIETTSDEVKSTGPKSLVQNFLLNNIL